MCREITIHDWKEDDENTQRTHPTDRDPLGVTSFFEAVAHPRRRAIILLLAATPNKTLTTDELATHIAMLECTPQVPRRQITNVRTSLKRSHQSPLENSSIISVNGETITRCKNYDQALIVVASGIER